MRWGFEGFVDIGLVDPMAFFSHFRSTISIQDMGTSLFQPASRWYCTSQRRKRAGLFDRFVSLPFIFNLLMTPKPKPSYAYKVNVGSDADASDAA
ncbi:hypothetical protein PILCRDRAFT_823716 [Piloderma croceum F 1598]|uniref:Uncharacterized protein n=1 Tax=Piloderma croceum (strain F 1598) TaxID=765440 RepID=A0A0C3FH61_PILCF|nr:hypothetical protein PILCRDRAFT_823716 [Piloderma croceum F 1598]